VRLLSVEQQRLTASYRAELCSVMKTRWGCDVTLEPPLLNIPVVPCNFIPINAQLYSGIILLLMLFIANKHGGRPCSLDANHCTVNESVSTLRHGNWIEDAREQVEILLLNQTVPL